MSVQAKIAKIMLRLQLSGWSPGSIEEQRAKQEKAPDSPDYLPMSAVSLSLQMAWQRNGLARPTRTWA